MVHQGKGVLRRADGRVGAVAARRTRARQLSPGCPGSGHAAGGCNGCVRCGGRATAKASAAASAKAAITPTSSR